MRCFSRLSRVQQAHCTTHQQLQGEQGLSQQSSRIWLWFGAATPIKHLQPGTCLSLSRIILSVWRIIQQLILQLVGVDMKNETYIVVLVKGVEEKMDLNSKFPAKSWVWSYLSFTSALQKSSAFWFLLFFFSFWGFWFHLAPHWQQLQEPKEEGESEWRQIVNQRSSAAFWPAQSLLTRQVTAAWNSPAWERFTGFQERKHKETDDPEVSAPSHPPQNSPGRWRGTAWGAGQESGISAMAHPHQQGKETERW